MSKAKFRKDSLRREVKKGEVEVPESEPKPIKAPDRQDSFVGHGKCADPIKFARLLWPSVHFYKQQEAIIYSVVENKETVCVAGNELGKDFVAGFLVLWFFMTRHPCKVVTTSADYSQLEAVLWGEVRRFIQTSAIPLVYSRKNPSGPLIVNHMHIRKMIPGTDKVCGVSYCIGRVAKKGEGMLGHHVTEESAEFYDDGVPRTLFLADEASGVDDITYDRSQTWADRKLFIGNPFPCSNFFFRKSEEEGDKPIDSEDLSKGYYQKIINIEAIHSPNVRVALAEQQCGREPSGKNILPGVLTYEKYKTRLATWDPIMLSIGIHAKFWKGKEVLLYPPEWLNRSNLFARDIRTMRRKCEGIGIDPAEGGDKTAFAAVDRYGLIELDAFKTPDTTIIPDRIIAFAKAHGIEQEDANKIMVDRGGGGKQIYDTLRKRGWMVNTVAFGEPVMDRRKYLDEQEKVEKIESRYVYVNRRAQLYGRLRELLDPSNEQGFALPPGYTDLRKQLAPIPLLYDKEGRLYLPPKHRKAGEKKNPNNKTLIEIIGHSPDEAEALVIAIYAMEFKDDEAPYVGSLFGQQT